MLYLTTDCYTIVAVISNRCLECDFAEAVTSCRYVLGSLLDPVFAHAQIFSSNEGSVVFRAH